MNPLIEKLAELEHIQWMHWSKDIAKRFQTEPFFNYQLGEWQKSWIPYSQLSEGQKQLDREWAIKALELVIGHYKDKFDGKVELKISDEENV